MFSIITYIIIPAFRVNTPKYESKYGIHVNRADLKRFLWGRVGLLPLLILQKTSM